jgi:hypothetical protein
MAVLCGSPQVTVRPAYSSPVSRQAAPGETTRSSAHAQLGQFVRSFECAVAPSVMLPDMKAGPPDVRTGAPQFGHGSSSISDIAEGYAQTS